MRKLSIIVAMVLFATASNAQNGIRTLYGGNGASGYSGDGGPATAASVGMYGLATDNAGNIYLADNSNGVVRMINTAGIISTVAGNGSSGYSGDGGPATAAQTWPGDMAIDAAGNIYIADDLNHRVRKINTAGIITTIAGDGTNGYGGDGGPATNAQMGQVDGIAVDGSGNVYCSDKTMGVVRKINAAGIITTVAGNGSTGYGGDGAAATAAMLNNPKGIAFDYAGNLYIGDGGNHRVRKVTPAGIISTIAGTGVSGYSGDGGPGNAAQLANPSSVNVSPTGDVYICEFNSYHVRKVNPLGVITTVAGNGGLTCVPYGGTAINAGIAPIGVAFDQNLDMYIGNNICNSVDKVTSVPDVVSDSFSLFITRNCNGVGLVAMANSTSTLNMKVAYGDNTPVATLPLTPTTGNYQTLNLNHIYALPGEYTIRLILLNGATAIDSIIYSYNCVLCNTFAVGFYYDADNSCKRELSEPYSYFPITTVVDSNGITIDTISATSGFRYTAYGNIGDIYRFRVISLPGGILASCGTGGIITDTLQPGLYNTDSKDLPLTCSSAPGFDLKQIVSARAGRHTFAGEILVSNNYCTPQTATVTMNISPKYAFQSATPAPTSSTATTVTWTLNSVSATFPQDNIRFTCEVPGSWLMPGDTVNSGYITDPVTGDMVAGNNSCDRVDTVKSSFDPNEMQVSPEGYIASGTQLQYTIHFENDGNDTAENIYILDTISSYVIPSSMRIIASSAIMNVIPIKSGAYNILKFDFPHIKLPDSSHHDVCRGMVMFTINTRTGLPYGTVIPNQAGIYFDDNEVVMTNNVENIIPYPSVCCLPPVKGDVSIYPNPANDELMVRMDYGGHSSFTISNSIGQTLVQRDLTGNITKVDLRSFAPGMYYITLRGESGTQVQKFAKK